MAGIRNAIPTISVSINTSVRIRTRTTNGTGTGTVAGGRGISTVRRIQQQHQVRLHERAVDVDVDGESGALHRVKLRDRTIRAPDDRPRAHQQLRRGVGRRAGRRRGEAGRDGTAGRAKEIGRKKRGLRQNEDAVLVTETDGIPWSSERILDATKL
jgi:hypothetical protein